MDHEIAQRIITYWRRTFFLEPFLILLLIFCFVIGLLHHQKNKERFFFLVYFFVGIAMFIENTTIVVCKILSAKQLAIEQEIANTTFESIEFVAFYYFFQKSLQNKRFKKFMKLFLYVLLTIVGIFFIGLTFPNYSTDNINEHSLCINVIEFFFLLAMCLAYFHELFANIPNQNLFKRPSFFIVTSAFFYTILMIPFFLVAYDLLLTDLVFYQVFFACHYLLLMILLLSIAKALLCKTPITA